MESDYLNLIEFPHKGNIFSVVWPLETQAVIVIVQSRDEVLQLEAHTNLAILSAWQVSRKCPNTMASLIWSEDSPTSCRGEGLFNLTNKYGLD